MRLAGAAPSAHRKCSRPSKSTRESFASKRKLLVRSGVVHNAHRIKLMGESIRKRDGKLTTEPKPEK